MKKSLRTSITNARPDRPSRGARRPVPPSGQTTVPSSSGHVEPAGSSALVSVIIPARNAERFIAITLESVLSQTYRNLEVLIVDDGSSDKTLDIVNSFAARDPRVQLMSQTHAGVSSARNQAIAASKGEFIAMIDADDIWHPDKIRQQVGCMLRGGPRVGLVYSWSRIIDDSELPISEIVYEEQGDVLAALVYTNIIGNGSAPLIRRSCFDRIGMFDDQYSPCEDWDLYLRIAERYEFRFVPAFQIGYRRTLTGASADYRKMAKRFGLLMKGFEERHPEMPHSIFRLSQSHFLNYLSALSNESGNYLASIKYLLESLWLDRMRLLSSQSYIAFAKWCLRVIAKPVTVLLWEHQSSWRKVKRSAKRLVNRHASTDAFIDSAGGTAYSPRLYDRIHNRRMARYRQKIRMNPDLP